MRSETQTGGSRDVNNRAQVGVSNGAAVSTNSWPRRQLARSSKSHHTGSGLPLFVRNSIATSTVAMAAAETGDSNEIHSDSVPRFELQANCLAETAPVSPRQLSQAMSTPAPSVGEADKTSRNESSERALMLPPGPVGQVPSTFPPRSRTGQ